MSSGGGSESWKEVTDSKSGRVYYYNKKTKETTWNKPMELATPKEREKMLQKKNEQLEFFAEMEANIKRKIKEAALITVTSRDSLASYGYDYDNGLHDLVDSTIPQFATLKWEDFDVQAGEFKTRPLAERGRGTRSISSMDDDIIRTMRRTESNTGLNTEYYLQRTDSSDLYGSRSLSNEMARNSLNAMRSRTFSNTSIDSFEGYTLADAKVDREMKRVDSMHLMAKQNKCSGNRSRTTSRDKPYTTSDAVAEPKNNNTIQPYKRRNSTGTIYVESTMSNQDDDSTMMAVCIIIRAHMILAAKEKRESAKQYDVFKDINLTNEASSPKHSHIQVHDVVPSLNAIKEYFKNIFSRSQLESECIIMTLIYIERLVKCTTGKLCIRHDNWKSIMFSALMMSSKVWDDLSMWNIDFSQAARGFTLSHVNELEICFLDAVGYSIRVTAGEYAKYYFHLRSMMVKLGFTDYKKNGVAPLNIDGARKLQLATEKYQTDKKEIRRCKSVLEIAQLDLSKINLQDASSYIDENKHIYSIVGLEQLINENHTDADGSTKRSFSQKLKSSFSSRKSDPASNKNNGESKVDESKSYHK